MTPEQLKERIETLAPETNAEIMDLTGTQNHYKAVVVSPFFEGKMTMEQHRAVFDLLKKEMESGEVHALSLKTLTPAEYSQATE